MAVGIASLYTKTAVSGNWNETVTIPAGYGFTSLMCSISNKYGEVTTATCTIGGVAATVANNNETVNARVKIFGRNNLSAGDYNVAVTCGSAHGHVGIIWAVYNTSGWNTGNIIEGGASDGAETYTPTIVQGRIYTEVIKADSGTLPTAGSSQTTLSNVGIDELKQIIFYSTSVTVGTQSFIINFDSSNTETSYTGLEFKPFKRAKTSIFI